MTEIFVFGSNLAGIHGKGAAKTALIHHGAKYYQGYGLQGRSFAIPTKDANLKTLPLEMVFNYVNLFKEFAVSRQDLKFKVTRIGCGLAGFEDEEIFYAFFGSPKNCYFDTKWLNYMGPSHNYWGTF